MRCGTATAKAKTVKATAASKGAAKAAVASRKNGGNGAKTTKAAAGRAVSMRSVARAIIFVRDFDRAVKFYTETLGIPLQYAEDGWAALDTMGIEVNLHAGRETKARSDETLVCFRVDDLDGVHSALKAKGVKMGEIHSPCGGLRCTGFPDPDGNRIGLEGV